MTTTSEGEPWNPFTSKKFKRFRSVPRRSPGFRSFVRTYAAYNQHCDPVSHHYLRRFAEQSPSRGLPTYSLRSDYKLLHKTIAHDVKATEPPPLSYPPELDLNNPSFTMENTSADPIKWELLVPPYIHLSQYKGTLAGGES